MRSKNEDNFLDKYDGIEKICNEININFLHINSGGRDVQFTEEQLDELSNIIASINKNNYIR